MFRVLHTADWHLDAQPKFLQEKSQEYKNRRYKTAEAIADRAQHEKVDSVLIAGDLFDRETVRDSVLSRTIEILNRFGPIPVYIIPGNHDPLIPDGVWQNPLWKKAGDHIHLCRDEPAVEIAKNVMLYPCPLSSKSSSEDPTRGIPARDEGDTSIRIGLAHGSIQHREEYVEIPIDPARAATSGLTYLALGHWHSPFTDGRTVYPGGIEPTRSGEPVGSFTTVAFADGLRDPDLKQIECGRFCWHDGAPEICTVEDVQRLRDAVALKTKYDLVLRLEPDISRVEDATVLDELDRLRADYEERAFFNGWEYDDYRRIELMDLEAVPAGILRSVWEGLERMLAQERPDGDPAIARAALMELQRAMKEVKR